MPEAMVATRASDATIAGANVENVVVDVDLQIETRSTSIGQNNAAVPCVCPSS